MQSVSFAFQAAQLLIKQGIKALPDGRDLTGEDIIEYVRPLKKDLAERLAQTYPAPAYIARIDGNTYSLAELVPRYVEQLTDECLDINLRKLHPESLYYAKQAAEYLLERPRKDTDIIKELASVNAGIAQEVADGCAADPLLNSHLIKLVQRAWDIHRAEPSNEVEATLNCLYAQVRGTLSGEKGDRDARLRKLLGGPEHKVAGFLASKYPETFGDVLTTSPHNFMATVRYITGYCSPSDFNREMELIGLRAEQHSDKTPAAAQFQTVNWQMRLTSEPHKNTSQFHLL